MIDLLNKYPKSAKLVRDYYTEKLLKSLSSDLPEEFKQHVKQQGITNERVANMIKSMPRALFDFFDENEIYILINITGIKDISVTFNIHALKGYFGEKVFNNRTDCEKEAITEAFNILERKL